MPLASRLSLPNFLSHLAVRQGHPCPAHPTHPPCPGACCCTSVPPQSAGSPCAQFTVNFRATAAMAWATAATTSCPGGKPLTSVLPSVEKQTLPCSEDEPGVLGAPCRKSNFVLRATTEVKFVSFLGKLSHRGVKRCAQGHSASEWDSQCLNRGDLPQSSHALP